MAIPTRSSWSLRTARTAARLSRSLPVLKRSDVKTALGSERDSARPCATVSVSFVPSKTSTGWRNIGRYAVSSASAYGSPITSGDAVPSPLTRKAVTFNRCQDSRSSRSRTAILVSKRTGTFSSSVLMLRDSRVHAFAVLYVPCVTPRQEISAWRPPVAGVVEVLHAHFTEHAYPMHVHDAWTLLIVDDGAVRYDLDRYERGTPSDTVSLLPPRIPHNGSSATPHGFRKRVLYLDMTQLDERFIGPAVDGPDLTDPVLRRRVGQLHAALANRSDEFEAASRLAL